MLVFSAIKKHDCIKKIVFKILKLFTMISDGLFAKYLHLLRLLFCSVLCVMKNKNNEHPVNNLFNSCG